MWAQLLASLFGGTALGWLSHALYIKPTSQNKTLASVVDGVIAPIALTAAGSIVSSASAGKPVALGQVAQTAEGSAVVAVVNAASAIDGSAGHSTADPTADPTPDAAAPPAPGN
jgi:flagellar biosynthesis component FlhA